MNVIKRSIVFAAMLLTIGAGVAGAEELVVADVPFPFVVNGYTLPAGHYEVRTDDQDPSIITIVGTGSTRDHAIVLTNPKYGHDPAGENPALTFVRDENQYRLAAIWESSDYAREVPRH
jgi:hypothetical protein